MGSLSTDAMVTLASAIPGLLLSSLSAWLAYLTLRRQHHLDRTDLETSTKELVTAQAHPAGRLWYSPYRLTSEVVSQLPPAAYQNAARRAAFLPAP
ncbi:hypothetical protein FSARC_2155 [Fusarium sarcochroum]|uniref:Uncharacterized protein n=1 Tax=Fusarium sarcochroum TaxID=1208366 RepID=A0A8H4U7A5_9HYPO|nr:hypothetical protein FSARC_2155 [Fusarium sarcochroum]